MEVVARRIDVTGTVQAVGFRPFVWRLAHELGVTGTVRNRGGRVEIEACGPLDALDRMVLRLRADAPPRAVVESVTSAPSSTRVWDGFQVVDSGPDPTGDRLFPPDLATCDACLRELFDPADRRYRYPFINCTDCGPRASIIDALPYDRPRTTMVDFPLCPDCRAEYLDPADRRFHAEPVACPACGPRLRFTTAGDAGTTGEAALAAAVAALAAGAVVAVKGIGGYHLAADATNEAAVARLRERKHRPAKPFAVMVADLATARRLVELGRVHEDLLTGPARPIVLARRRPSTVDGAGAVDAVDGADAVDAVHAVGPMIARSVGLDNRDLGLFLPYTGLHHLLLAGLGRPLVLTSGNAADEPIAIDDGDARERLGGIADAFLGHDRRIRSRYEDSVVTVAGGRPVPLRRGRGLAPVPVELPVPTPVPLLAVGAQLKHTFTIATGSRAYVAPHTGDLEDLATYDSFIANLAHLRELLDVAPAVLAHDRHPAYLSTQYAEREAPASRRIAVQHHHAHIASCAAEHGITAAVVGVALDGLGLGDDGTFWGGEILVCDLVGYRRVARFGRAPMPGGAAAVREPWRMALGYLYGGEFGALDPAVAHPFAGRFEARRVAAIRRQIERGLNAPVASSAGRLFDAASALLGLREVATYEAEAAIALEQAADPDERVTLPSRIRSVDGLAVYDPGPTLVALLRGRARGIEVPVLAARFQQTVAQVVARLAADAAAAAGLDVVCLSGGVFANRLVSTRIGSRLRAAGLTVVHNERIPCGDGGISYGQAAVAAARLAGVQPTHGEESVACASASPAG